MNAFIALDFETANGNAASVCSVGMVKVIDHMMTETFYTVVNPETYFSNGNIAVHGITADDVKDAPTFREVYPHMLDFIDGLPVVAHFAQFDMKVLYASIERYGFEIPTLRYFCSCIMARRTVKNHSYSLKNMMTYYDLDFHGHHNALNDAKASAMITVRLLKSYDTLDSYLNRHSAYLSSMKHRKSKASQMSKYHQSLAAIQPETATNREDHPFYNQKIAITGTLHLKRKEIVQYIVNHGGEYAADIEDCTVFLMGKQKSTQPSKKEKIVASRIALGQNIVLISDDKLKQLIAFYE